MFALSITSYIYLKGRVPHWPPGVSPPELRWGTLNVIILLVSIWPNLLAKKGGGAFRTERRTPVDGRLHASSRSPSTSSAFFEFSALNVRWDTNAYGSMTWMLLGLHTTHVLTDFLDSGVLTAVMFCGTVDEHRFVDVSENAMYWNFVVLSWLPIYAVIYLAPRVV